MKKLLLVMFVAACMGGALKAEYPCDTSCNVGCYCADWYLATRGALTWHNTGKIHGPLGSGVTRFDVGGSASVAIGYNLPCWNLRIEGEGLYQRNSVKTVALNGLDPAFFDGLATVGNCVANGASTDFALMANLFYDYCLTQCVKLYVGAGLGVSFNRLRVSTDNQPVPMPGATVPIGVISLSQVGKNIAQVYNAIGQPQLAALASTLHETDTNTVFAWNIMAGFTYALNPCWNLDLGYRLFVTSKLSYNRQAGFGKTNTPIVNRAEIGLRYAF